MLKDSLIAKMIADFKKYNPRLTVIKVIRYRWRYIVIAVFDVKNGLREMNPFYLYNPVCGHIRGYCPTENIRRFGRFMKLGKVIYIHPSIKEESDDSFRKHAKCDN